MDAEASRGRTGREVKPEVQDSQTSRARIAQEPKLVEQPQSPTRPITPTVIILLGLFMALQLYMWMRLEELTTLGQQREARAALAQANLQEDIERQRAALNQAVQQMASLGHAPPRAVLPGLEGGKRGPAAAFNEQPKHTPASKGARIESLAAPSSGAGRPNAGQDRRAAARETPAQDLSTMLPASTVISRSPSAMRADLSSSLQGSAPPTTSRTPSARQNLEAIQNEPQEDAETSGKKLSLPDTAIARDHNEIEKLRKLGKRDYVEFTLVRSKTRQEVTPDISLQLRKVDSKGLRCAISIYAEGYEFPTDLTINEPVGFPIRAMWESVDLVINKIGKDNVAGYLSSRKGVLVGGK